MDLVLSCTGTRHLLLICVCGCFRSLCAYFDFHSFLSVVSLTPAQKCIHGYIVLIMLVLGFHCAI